MKKIITKEDLIKEYEKVKKLDSERIFYDKFYNICYPYTDAFVEWLMDRLINNLTQK